MQVSEEIALPKEVGQIVLFLSNAAGEQVLFGSED